MKQQREIQAQFKGRKTNFVGFLRECVEQITDSQTLYRICIEHLRTKKGVYLTDHVWIVISPNKVLEVQRFVGMEITFEANITMYAKRTRYGLRRIRNLRTLRTFKTFV